MSNDYHHFKDQIDEHLWGAGQFKTTSADSLESIQRQYNSLKGSEAYIYLQEAMTLLEKASIAAEQSAEDLEAMIHGD